MTPEKQDKTSKLSKHWSPNSAQTRNEIMVKTTLNWEKFGKCNKICSKYKQMNDK